MNWKQGRKDGGTELWFETIVAGMAVQSYELKGWRNQESEITIAREQKWRSRNDVVMSKCKSTKMAEPKWRHYD